MVRLRGLVKWTLPSGIPRARMEPGAAMADARLLLLACGLAYGNAPFASLSTQCILSKKIKKSTQCIEAKANATNRPASQFGTL